MKLKFTVLRYYLFFAALLLMTRVEAQVEFGLSRVVRPLDVAKDPFGNYYVLTTYNIQVFDATSAFVRRISIPQVGANEISPQAIEVTADGNVIVLENANQKVLALNSAGTLLYSFGSYGNGNGQFYNATDMELDSDGNIYVADVGRQVISVFTKAGVFLRTIGLGYFTQCRAVSIAPNGDVYGADGMGRKVFVFGSDGSYKFSFGSSGDGAGQFSRDANGIQVGPDGSVYVVMPDGEKTNVYQANGTFKFSFAAPLRRLKVETASIVAPDYWNHAVRFYNLDGSVSSKTPLGNESEKPGKLDNPSGIAFDSEGYIYVADRGNVRIQVFNQKGEYVRQFGSQGSADNQFQRINAIALDINDNVYVIDGETVKVLTKSGVFIRKFGMYGSGNGQFYSPLGLTVTDDGLIYVADTFNKRCQIFNSDGSYRSQISVGEFVYTVGHGPSQFYVGFGEAFVNVYRPDASYNGLLKNPGYGNLGIKIPCGVVADQNFIYVRDRLGIVVHKRAEQFAQARFGSQGEDYGQFVFGSYYNDQSIAISRDKKVLAVSDLLRVQLFPLTNEITFPELDDRPFVKDETFTLSATNSNNFQVTFSSSDPLIASIAGNVVTVHKPGKVTITATQVGTALTPAVSVERELEILGTPQTITFNLPAMVELNEEFILLNAETSSGLSASYSSDNVEVASLMGNTNTLQLHKPGTVNLTATQSGNEIYSPATPVTVKLIIDKVDQTIAFSQPNIKRLSDAPFELTGVSSSGLTISYTSSDPNIISVENNIATIHAKGNTTITATQSGDDYYHPATAVTLDFTVGKETQNITFNPIEPQPVSKGTLTLAATASSGLPVTFESDNTTVASIDGNTLILHRPGTVWVTARQNGNDEFVAAIARSILVTIVKNSQAITFAELEQKTFGNNAFPLLATTSANLPVLFESSNPAIASVSDATVTIHKAGTVTITARQSGDEFTNAAVPVARTLTIRKATSAVEFASIGNRIVGELPLTLSGVSSHPGTIRFESSNPSVASIQNNILSFNTAGTVTITAIFDETENVLGSRSSQEVVVELVTSIEDAMSPQARAYPNPVNKILTLQLREEKVIRNVTVILGSGHEQTVIPVSNGDGLFVVDLAFLPQGLHFLRVQGETRLYVIKIVKQ